MTTIKTQLFDAFREDHAVLGRGLHKLRTALADGDIAGAKAAACALDRSAGAHIAFEEEHFYPALAAFLSPEEVDTMYDEHQDGARLLDAIAALGEGASADEADTANLIAAVDRMASHVSECGQLFGALGGLPEEAMDDLYKHLIALRERAPEWSEVATHHHRARPAV